MVVNIIEGEVGTEVGQQETDAEELHICHSPVVISVNGGCHVIEWMTGGGVREALPQARWGLELKEKGRVPIE
jgi:hypothetical protein